MDKNHLVIKPELFTLGTVGPKGSRVFFFQSISEGSAETISLKCEKQQVEAIADAFEGLLSSNPAEYNIPLEDLQATEPDASYEPWAAGDMSIWYSTATDEIELKISNLNPAFDDQDLSDVFNAIEEQGIDFSEEDLGKVALEDLNLPDRIREKFDDISTPKQTLKFILSREQADGFMRIAKELIGQGRPLCTFCHAPLNHAPENNFCPCWN